MFGAERRGGETHARHPTKSSKIPISTRWKSFSLLLFYPRARRDLIPSNHVHCAPTQLASPRQASSTSLLSSVSFLAVLCDMEKSKLVFIISRVFHSIGERKENPQPADTAAEQSWLMVAWVEYWKELSNFESEITFRERLCVDENINSSRLVFAQLIYIEKAYKFA